MAIPTPAQGEAVNTESTNGRLSKEKFGYSMPVHAPLYQPPPHYYRGARAIFVRYETDYEMALDLLPDALQLPKPATAIVMVIDYPFSTFGAYSEAIQGLECLWEGTPRTFVVHILVTSEAALAGGREIWGDPKKLAHIELRSQNELLVGTVERPHGTRLCTVMVRPQRLLEPPVRAHPTVNSIALRVIPNPESEAEPSIAELVEVPDEPDVHELWDGTGSLSFDTTSSFDPWSALPVRRIKRGYYRSYDLRSPAGKILKRY